MFDDGVTRLPRVLRICVAVLRDVTVLECDHRPSRLGRSRSVEDVWPEVADNRDCAVEIPEE
jgi:hypothetical protein